MAGRNTTTTGTTATSKRQAKPKPTPKGVPDVDERTALMREQQTKEDETAHSTFVSLQLSPESLSQISSVVKQDTSDTCEGQIIIEEDEMKTRRARNQNLANPNHPNNPATSPTTAATMGATNAYDGPPPQPGAPTNEDDGVQAQGPRGTKRKARAQGGRSSSTSKSARLSSPDPQPQQPRRAKSILKKRDASSAFGTTDTNPSTPTGKRQKATPSTRKPARKVKKTVTLDPEPEIIKEKENLDESPSSINANSNEENETPVTSSDIEADDVNHYSEEDKTKGGRRPCDEDTTAEMADAPAPSQRPQLKLKLSKRTITPTEGGGMPTPATNPTSAIRTPSIKLKFGGTPHPAPGDNAPAAAKPKKSETTPAITPASSTKKRKRQLKVDENDDEPGPKKPPTIRKLTLTQPSQPAKPPKPTQTQTLKIKSKGKVPKRPLGVGYDSELEDRENDPVVHEGFVLRMQPGPDCDYLKKAIEDGSAGLPRAKGGADIRMRMLDTLGRRGIIIIRGNQYATTMVDLPCIVEGMKSWDKKGWIKSIDVSQMLLVLGRCYTDEEARNYPLPEDVDPKSYQFAHGLTAPMKWVRKRRFAKTKRARVDDIEAVERRVTALLEADKAAVSTRYQLLDHDPRLDEERYSSGLEDVDDEDIDAEGEDDDEIDGYFSLQNGRQPGGGMVETPMFTETPVEDIGQDEVDEFERMFEENEASSSAAVDTTSQAANTLHIPDVGDSSFAVTSTSASPSVVTAAHTPASAAGQTSDEEDDDDEEEDLDDAEKEGDENLQQIKDRIEDMQQKIAEQTGLLKQTQNAILKKKLARKIQDLKDDVAMMKKNAGLGGDEDDD